MSAAAKRAAAKRAAPERTDGRPSVLQQLELMKKVRAGTVSQPCRRCPSTSFSDLDLPRGRRDGHEAGTSTVPRFPTAYPFAPHCDGEGTCGGSPTKTLPAVTPQDLDENLDKTMGECETLRKQIEKGASGLGIEEIESMARVEFKKMRSNIKQISRSVPLAPRWDPTYCRSKLKGPPSNALALIPAPSSVVAIGALC